jgi:hypothetical protein
MVVELKPKKAEERLKASSSNPIVGLILKVPLELGIDESKLARGCIETDGRTETAGGK